MTYSDPRPPGELLSMFGRSYQAITRAHRQASRQIQALSPEVEADLRRLAQRQTRQHAIQEIRWRLGSGIFLFWCFIVLLAFGTVLWPTGLVGALALTATMTLFLISLGMIAWGAATWMQHDEKHHLEMPNDEE